MDKGDTVGIIRLNYELAYLQARLDSGMHLGPKDWARLSTLRLMLARDPGQGRRAHRRFAVRAKGVVVADGRRFAIEVEEISAGGCRILSPALFRPSIQLQLSIELRRATFVFGAKVQRANVKDGKARLALSFVGIPLELRRLRTRPPLLLDALEAEAS